MYYLRRKIEKEVQKLAEQLNIVHVAHATSELKMEEEVTKLTEQLGVNEMSMTMVVKEETDKVE